MIRRSAIAHAIVLLTAISARAQAPVPTLQYTPPLNFYKSAMTNPEDFSSNEVNASMQVYPFRPFTGNIQQAFGQTLLRDWIDPRYRETNVATRPEFSSEMVPGAQAAFMARFVDNIVGLPRPHVRVLIVAGNAAAIVDMSSNSPATWQRAAPVMTAALASVRVVPGAAAPQVPTVSSPANRALAGVYMGYKQKFQVNLWGGVGSGTFTPALHFFLLSADGRVYRTFDPLKLPPNGPGGFDFATAAREDPENTGRFNVQGAQLLIQFGGPGAELIQTAVSPAGGFTASGVTYARQ
jgi:hypothetical protein